MKEERTAVALDVAMWRGQLEAAHRRFAQAYPGEGTRRQPLHTVYGGAQLFRSDSAVRIGQVALRTLREYAPDAEALARAIALAPEETRMADAIHARVIAKLEREPVEDFRIDFEDGYGNRPDAEEDGHAAAAAAAVAEGMRDGTLPGSIGIRVKPLSEELTGRSLRTLDIFLTTLVRETNGDLPANFVVTLPKVVVPEQAEVFARVLEALEAKLALPQGALVFEFMVETPQILFDADGRAALPRVLAASRGRAVAAHFGTYDYTAACNITAAYQHMQHPSCDFARQMMQVCFAGTGLWLSDGSTAVLPVPPHRGDALSAAQEAENREVVHRAWRAHYADVRDSLMRGFYQGWDLHPAQLVTRYAAVYAFFLSGVDAAGERLRNFMEKAAQATLLGENFDDAATGQGLLNFFLRAIAAGAVSEEETVARTGLTLEELRLRSFAKILKARR